MRWRRGTGGEDRENVDGASASSHVRPLTQTTSDEDATEAPEAGWEPKQEVPAGISTDGVEGFEKRPPAPQVEVPLDVAEVDPDELARATRRAVARALAEDLGDRGDVTSLSTVPPGMTGSAELVARASGVVAGLAVVEAVFDQVDARVEVELHVADGDRVERGDVIGTVSGPLRSILTGERTALNFLCHLSGIATRTRAFVDAVEGTGCAVRDTRKTTPGLRLLEKAAVKAGGGHNHRIGLYDAILVKDNHIAAAGSIVAAAEGALRREGVAVQVEVADLDQIEDALRVGVTDILLDNFTPEQIRQAIQRVEGRAGLEASGNITLDNVRQYADTGVGRVAVGAITHSAPNLDIALDIKAEAIESPSYLSSVWTEGSGAPEADEATAAAEAADEPEDLLDEVEASDDASSDEPSESVESVVAAQVLEDRADEDADADEAPAVATEDAEDESSDDDGSDDEVVASDRPVLEGYRRDAAAEVTTERRETGAVSPEEGAVAAATDDEPREDAADEDEPASEDGLFAWRERQLGVADGRD